MNVPAVPARMPLNVKTGLTDMSVPVFLVMRAFTVPSTQMSVTVTPVRMVETALILLMDMLVTVSLDMKVGRTMNNALFSVR